MSNSLFASVAVNTVFNTNSGAVFSSGPTATSQVQTDMYTKLAIISRTINTLLFEYSKGNIYEVANTLTAEVYNGLSIFLAVLAMDSTKYPDYETLRKVNVDALSGMRRSVLQYSTLVDVQNKLAICEAKEAILYDPVRLKEWLEELRRQRTLLPDSNVQVIKAELKPEYAQYIKLYGLPDGCIFDPDKLSVVLNELNA